MKKTDTTQAYQDEDTETSVVDKLPRKLYISKQIQVITDSKSALMNQERVKFTGAAPRPEIATAFPDRFDKLSNIYQIRDMPEGKTGIQTAGRVFRIKRMGKLTFADLSDYTGSIQISLSVDVLGQERYATYLDNVANGDILGVTGSLYRTKKGELTVAVEDATLLAKSQRPMPEKWHGLQDQETKWRQRYVELFSDHEAMDRFMKRSRMVRQIRNYLEANGFVEVETPVLQHQISGANAKPFTTHHNALDENLVLRIAPETFLKRLIVGGYERVFEIGKNFRNESIDPEHLQEFTMLEYYAAYWNYRDNLNFTRRLLTSVIGDVNSGSLVVKFGVRELDFGSWRTVTFRDLVLADSGIDVFQHRTVGELDAEIRRRGIEVDREPGMSLGKLYDKLYKRVSRPNLIQPTIVTGYPTEIVPLARANRDDPRVLDMYQVLVNGWEIVKAYSELVDPAEQRKRFQEQAALRRAGDQEALDVDRDYLRAMEYGMPPVSGTGIGIDRLAALLTNSKNLREILLFPLLREEIEVQPSEKQRGGAL